MSPQKMGRPTQNPKIVSFNIRLDAECVKILNAFLQRHPEITKTEAVRIGIKMLANKE